MGYTVNCNGKYLWGPSLGVGQYFLTNVEALEKLLEKESGVVSRVADDIEIDYTKLKLFIDKVLKEFEESNNTPLLAMISGIAEVLLALEANITGDDHLRKGSERTAPLIEHLVLIFDDSKKYLARA